MKSQIITLCGSARFEQEFHLWNKVLTLSGHTVFSLGCFPSIEGAKDWYTEDQKIRLDAVHRMKISRSNAVLVLNVDGYIGDSTLSEIRHAELSGVEVHMLQSWGKGMGLNGSRSPIEATVNEYRNAAAMLPPVGGYRSSLVSMIKDSIKDSIGV